jgi:hypothetical protein
VSKRWRQATVVTLVLVATPVALAACSSSPSTKSGAGTNSPSGGAATAAATAAAKVPAGLCQQLEGIFADGPDADADPVGYALSQILPLQDVQTADASVMTAVTDLAAADQALVHANGNDKAATAAIKHADAALDRACPGVAS